MPRPLIAVDETKILEAYEETRSLREVARRLQVTRSVVTSRLRRLGVVTLPKHDAWMMSKHLQSLRPPERVTERVHHFDPRTVVTVRRYEEIDPCLWPGCENVKASVALCGGHNEFISTAKRSWSCIWTNCLQEVVSGALCYRHSKIVEGLARS